MIGKLAGGALVIAASAKIGFDAADKFAKRVYELKGFQSGLWLLKSEIEYSMTMMSDALQKCAALVIPSVGDVMLCAALAIDNGAQATAAWCEALDNCYLYLNETDKAVLKDFAAGLGAGSLETELSNIEKAIERLSECEKSAAEQQKKYGRLYRTAGISAGLAVFMLLV